MSETAPTKFEIAFVPAWKSHFIDRDEGRTRPKPATYRRLRRVNYPGNG